MQNQYWNLGFLAYYRLKQIPNFFLAAPVVVITCLSVMDFARAHCERRRMDKKGLKETILELLFVDYFEKKQRDERDNVDTNEVQHRPRSCFLLSADCFPFHVYTSFLLIFGLCFMHVQVITRMLFSSSPILYLFMGSQFLDAADYNDTKTLESGSKEEGVVQLLRRIIHMAKNSRLQKALLLYCGFYFVIGTLLHCNFLPWT